MNQGDQYLRTGHQVTILKTPDLQGFVEYLCNNNGEVRRCPVEQLVAKVEKEPQLSGPSNHPGLPVNP